MTYRVLSDRLPAPPGSLVDDIEGANLAALVEAGHLEPVDEQLDEDQGDDEQAPARRKRGGQ